MRQLTIDVPDALYLELEKAAAATREFGYGPEHWACDVIVSELAARRLPHVAMGALGARVGVVQREVEPEGYRVMRPERRLYA